MVLGGENGPSDVYLHWEDPTRGEVIIHANNACRVNATRNLRERLEQLLGEGNVWFSGGMGLPTHQPPKAPVNNDPPWKRKRAA